MFEVKYPKIFQKQFLYDYFAIFEHLDTSTEIIY